MSILAVQPAPMRLHPGMAMQQRSVMCRRPLRPLRAVADRPSSSGGAGLMERSGLDATRSRGLGGGSWRVLLIDSERHQESRVVDAIVQVVGTDESHALNCYHTARSIGQSIVTCAPKEHSEHYAQQLWQRGCKVTIEPDSTIL